jgi:PmbA protein
VRRPGGVEPEAVVARALEAMEGAGISGEVYLENSRQTKVAVSDQAVESLSDRRDLGLGIRVFEAGGAGFAFTTDFDPDALAATVAAASRIARHTGPDAAWRLPEPVPIEPLPFPNEDPEGREASWIARIEMAMTIEQAARAVDPRVSRTREAAFEEYSGRVWVASTAGVSVAHAYSRAVGRVQVTATEGGESQVGVHLDFALGATSLDPAEIGRLGASRALAKLGGEAAGTIRVPAVLDREVVAGLLDALSPAFSARRVLKGTSVLAGRLGEPVASAAVGIVDDPRLPGGFSSAPVDGEGLATRRVTLVEDGCLRAYLHDTYSHLKMSAGEPGNSIRHSYDAPPVIGTMNLMLLPGPEPVDALLERAGEGVWIHEVMGLHTVDPVTGDFSLGGNGRRIRGGRPGGPVDRLAISGNLLELLSGIEAVGSDLKLLTGGGGAPSVLVGELSVAGSPAGAV